MQNDDLSLLGGAPGLPTGDLNLAGVQGFPRPGEIARASSPPEVLLPDYLCPDLSQPMLHGADPARMPLSVPDDLVPDPLLPDLTEAPLPYALDLQAGLSQPDPTLPAEQVGDTESFSVPPGLGFAQLQVTRSLQTPDPLLPDLRPPELASEVVMPANERPGSLDPGALEVMHQSLRYQQLADKQYHQVYMDGHGVNDRRSRELTLLMKGLDAEEQGKEL